MALAVVSSSRKPAPPIRVALVRTTASCAAAYNEFRRALVARGLEVSEAGIGSIGADHRRRVAASGGVGWVFVVCRMAADDMATTRLIQAELDDVGLSRGDCVVLTPLETRGAAQAAAVVRKVEMNQRLDAPRTLGRSRSHAPHQSSAADSDVRTQVHAPVRLVADDEGESRSETEMTMPYEVVPEGSTRVYESVRERAPSTRAAVPRGIGESVVARRSNRGLKAVVALAAAGCLAGLVAWQWDGLTGLLESNPEVASRTESSVSPEAGAPALDEPEQAADAEPPTAEQAPEAIETVADAIDDEVVNDVELVAAALEARSIRALDSVLVDRQRSKRIGFADAKARCDGHEVDGVTGWRLPEIGELRSLTKKRMLPKGRYWTSNAANLAGSHQLVWDAVRKDIAISSRDSKRVRSVCVRDHAGHGLDS